MKQTNCWNATNADENGNFNEFEKLPDKGNPLPAAAWGHRQQLIHSERRGSIITACYIVALTALTPHSCRPHHRTTNPTPIAAEVIPVHKMPKKTSGMGLLSLVVSGWPAGRSLWVRICDAFAIGPPMSVCRQSSTLLLFGSAGQVAIRAPIEREADFIGLLYIYLVCVVTLGRL